jgi:hypothetical protein
MTGNRPFSATTMGSAAALLERRYFDGNILPI